MTILLLDPVQLNSKFGIFSKSNSQKSAVAFDTVLKMLKGQWMDSFTICLSFSTHKPKEKPPCLSLSADFSSKVEIQGKKATSTWDHEQSQVTQIKEIESYMIEFQVSRIVYVFWLPGTQKVKHSTQIVHCDTTWNLSQMIFRTL